MLRVRRGMRPLVHADDLIVTPEHTFQGVGDQLTRDGINPLHHPHVGPGAAHEVRRRVRLRPSDPAAKESTRSNGMPLCRAASLKGCLWRVSYLSHNSTVSPRTWHDGDTGKRRDR